MSTLSRREFVRVGAVAGGGMLVGVSLPAVRPDRPGAQSAGTFNAFLQINPNGTVVITAPAPEIGQGVRTSLPMLITEELGAAWKDVTVRQASADPVYGGMAVGGSDSVVDYWEPLRRAGATARSMLIAAAATRWGVEPSTCTVDSGVVIHRASGRRQGFGELADDAARLPVPTDVTLKSREDFTLIGQRLPRIDTDSIVRGTAIYGLDVRVPNMLYAVVERCPVHGGTMQSFDGTAARAVEGVRDVVEVSPMVVGGLLYGAVRPGVAVIADHTWAAIQGRRALNIEWNEGAHANESTEGIRARFDARKHAPETRLRDEGSAETTIDASPTRVAAEYELPILAHACMEPMNFTVYVRKNGCEAWGPTQQPRLLRQVLAAALRIPLENVHVHPTMSGGGFGRRLAIDYGVEAAMVSRAVAGPVQVIWTREDDIRHDYYRAPSVHLLQGGLDANGRVTAWRHHILSASLLRNSVQNPSGPPATYDVQGAADFPFALDNVLIEYTPIDVGLQMGSWRSVSHSSNVFVVNAFVDELAAAAGRDPLELQRELIGEPRSQVVPLPLPGRRGRIRGDTGRLRGVLDLAAERGGWGRRLPEGWGRGIACTFYKNTYAAHVAEVSVDAGRVRVRRIVAAMDCGLVVDPSGAEAQVEGAAMDGVATVLKWGITVERGRVQEGNFDRYHMLLMNEAPAVDVHFVASDLPPSGLGEPPYPSVAPAITNAIYDAAGKRIRRLPMRDGDM